MCTLLSRLCGAFVRNHNPPVRFFSTTLSCRTSLTQKQTKRSRPEKSAVKDLVFSGIQPTGRVHLGNYFGAITRWVEMQDAGEDVMISIVDLHSITLPQDPAELRKNVLLMTATLLACGIDPEKTVLFQQSHVHQHTQLGWVLSTLTTMARLAHLPQYRDKIADRKEVPLGLFIYPVLQAADILLYKATRVPVGEDQVQHLQLAQHLARTFNRLFGWTFPEPRPVLAECTAAGRLRSLRDPGKKMSKSDADPGSRIELQDSAADLAAKVRKAVTDCTSRVEFEPDTRPGVANLVSMHSLATGRSEAELVAEASSLDTGQYKGVVADALEGRLRPIRERIAELLDQPDRLELVLRGGAEKAAVTAEETWREVARKVGMDSAFREQIDQNGEALVARGSATR